MFLTGDSLKQVLHELLCLYAEILDCLIGKAQKKTKQNIAQRLLCDCAETRISLMASLIRSYRYLLLYFLIFSALVARLFGSSVLNASTLCFWLLLRRSWKEALTGCHHFKDTVAWHVMQSPFTSATKMASSSKLSRLRPTLPC